MLWFRMCRRYTRKIGTRPLDSNNRISRIIVNHEHYVITTEMSVKTLKFNISQRSNDGPNGYHQFDYCRVNVFFFSPRIKRGDGLSPPQVVVTCSPHTGGCSRIQFFPSLVVKMIFNGPNGSVFAFYFSPAVYRPFVA